MPDQMFFGIRKIDFGLTEKLITTKADPASISNKPDTFISKCRHMLFQSHSEMFQNIIWLQCRGYKIYCEVVEHLKSEAEMFWGIYLILHSYLKIGIIP